MEIFSNSLTFTGNIKDILIQARKYGNKIIIEPEVFGPNTCQIHISSPENIKFYVLEDAMKIRREILCCLNQL